MLINKIEFTMDKVYTFGSKDAEHRFIVRNHFLKTTPHFKGLVKKEGFEVIIEITYTKASFDIDNVPKVIIDSFSGSQIQRDLEDLKTFREGGVLSDAKERAYKVISNMEDLYKKEQYESLAIYEEDTVGFVSNLSCRASASIDDITTIKVTIQ